MTTENQTPPVPTKEEIDAQVAQLVATQLADIKSKLDGAFAARDEAVREATRLKDAARAAELEALTAAGKHTEAAQLKLSALEEELKAARSKITSYERDSVVKESLRGLEFRNDRSADMAYRDIVDQLVQDQQGQWVHKTGVTIKDFVANFQKDEENAFLFKPKTNSGGGSSTPNGTPNIDPKRKMTELSTTEIMSLAAAGKLGTFTA
jgi:hypothetical protein